MIPNDISLEFKRLQFPVRLAFAMAINKSQGQSLSICGVNFQTPRYFRGQLYVCCSRVWSALLVYAPSNQTKYIVYPKALE